MVQRKRRGALTKGGALTKKEKRVVKALLNRGERNQDIQAFINTGRSATINGARITEVKQNKNQAAAPDEEAEFFQIKKRSFDPKTGLNLYDDERLIRAREAMILAVQIFNSTALNFKTEVFSVLANIAWTYLLHEHYKRKRIMITQDNDHSLPLSKILKRPDCPLSEGIKNNLRHMIAIRDAVEHKMFGRADQKQFSLFQACCLNFDKKLKEMFGERLTLTNDLAFALQFARMDIEQLSKINKHEIPDHIQSLDAHLSENLTEKQRKDLEYKLPVIYTLGTASKSKAHIQFVNPDSGEGRKIHNVLVKDKIADDDYPYKPKDVSELVAERTNKKFTIHHHTQAWKLHKVRQPGKAKQPENTNTNYCIYHKAHGDYTYSEKWVERLVEDVNDDQEFAKIKAVKV